jgi:inositol 1,4,5-triphosphate receptor type 1
MSSINFGKGENVCISIWQCVLTIFSLGPRSSGSVGDVIERQSYHIDNRDDFLFRWTFDVLVFIVINVIFMNITFGIIIDTFKVLRSRNNEIL